MTAKQRTSVCGVAFIRDEIFQRDREVQGARMEQMTAARIGGSCSGLLGLSRRCHEFRAVA
jgi:hypothetical protein